MPSKPLAKVCLVPSVYPLVPCDDAQSVLIMLSKTTVLVTKENGLEKTCKGGGSSRIEVIDPSSTQLTYVSCAAHAVRPSAKGLVDLLGVHAVKSVPFMVAARGRSVTYRRRRFVNRETVAEQI